MTIQQIEHVVVYRDDRTFSAWPFNGGMWQFADGQIAVGFMRGPCDYRSEKCTGHQTVDVEHVIVRSDDGGRTWPVESMTTVYPNRQEMFEKLKTVKVATAADRGYDPRADGWCLVSGFGIPPQDNPHHIFVMVSTDRGRTWSEPVRLPVGVHRTDGFRHVGGRPSYVVREDGVVLLFAHGSRQTGEDVSVPLVYGSWDGGASWGLIGEVPPVPARPMAIMPYPLILHSRTMLFATRRQYDGYNAHTQVYASEDDGLTWTFRSRVNEWGAPANLVQLPDGRIVCVYGYRQKPWGIRARISGDQGYTWGSELVLRDDGGSWDLGYPRTVLRPDGTLVTAYYFNRRDDPIQFDGGVRHIAATLWRV